MSFLGPLDAIASHCDDVWRYRNALAEYNRSINRNLTSLTALTLLKQREVMPRSRFETPAERDARYDMSGLWGAE